MTSIIDEVRVMIHSEVDIVTARQQGRRLALEAGFSTTEQALVVTAISELARNMVQYARGGEVTLGRLTDGPRQGVTVIARDEGPGIANLELAMHDGYSTSGGLGLGLPGSKRLMDEFFIDSAPGRGTTVRVIKWKR